MTKIGTITFHHACNNGAVLQAYALVEYLNSIPDVEAEIIDYRCADIHAAYQPEFCFHNCGWLKGLVKYLLRYRSIIGRNQKFEDYLTTRLKLSPERYDRAGIQEAAARYDYVISGSDQIWNDKLTGGDSTYLLDFVRDDSKKIAYAASLGFGSIETCCTRQYQELLDRYHALSVREHQAAAEIRRITGRMAAVHIDPVFLLEKKTWQAMAVRPEAERYILYYMVGMGRIVDESVMFAKELSKRTGRRLLFLNSEYIPYLYPDIRHIKTIVPDEYLGWILHADYVVTNSFHATCFSILFEKNCYSETDFRGGGRIANLLSVCGLEFRALHRGELVQGTVPDVETDWCRVKEKLTVSITESKRYLLKSVGK